MNPVDGQPPNVATEATCIEHSRIDLLWDGRFQVMMAIFTTLLAIFMIDVGPRIQFGAAALAISTAMQLLVPGLAAKTACLVLLAHGVFLNINADVQTSPADIIGALDRVQDAAIGIAAVWTFVGVWFALQPATHLEPTIKVVVAVAFEVLQLADIWNRFARTGDHRVVTVGLMYSDGPFCVAFALTLALVGTRGSDPIEFWGRLSDQRVPVAVTTAPAPRISARFMPPLRSMMRRLYGQRVSFVHHGEEDTASVVAQASDDGSADTVSLKLPVREKRRQKSNAPYSVVGTEAEVRACMRRLDADQRATVLEGCDWVDSSWLERHTRLVSLGYLVGDGLGSSTRREKRAPQNLRTGSEDLL